MSRIASRPVIIPSGVTVQLQDENKSIHIKGPKGDLKSSLNEFVTVTVEGNSIHVAKNVSAKPKKEQQHLAASISGTMRALLQNMVVGVHGGFEKKLQLVVLLIIRRLFLVKV